jgi:CheY-like chemotaxis protein
VNVLIVDDQAMNRLVLKRLLSRFAALTVHEAEDGEVAWEKLPLFDPALIFCDIFMPKVDGLSFMMRLREHPLYSDIPVIITSAGKDREVLLKLKELGITDYLLKPYELKSTYERLATHIQPMLDERKKGPTAALGSTGVIPVPTAEETPAEGQDMADSSDAPAPAADPSSDASGEPAESKG